MANYTEIPEELHQTIFKYLDQEKIIQELRTTIQFLQNKIQQLRANNSRLTLQSIQQLSDIQNLEYILANGEEPVQRQIDFDSDSSYDSDETIIDLTDTY